MNVLSLIQPKQIFLITNSTIKQIDLFTEHERYINIGKTYYVMTPIITYGSQILILQNPQHNLNFNEFSAYVFPTLRERFA